MTQDQIEAESGDIDSPLEWANKYYIINGSPYNLDSRKYLKEILNQNHQDVTIRKSAQVGLSEMAILRAIYFVQYYGENVFYGMPGADEIGQFVQGRVDPRIDESIFLQNLISKTNNIGIKRLGNKFIYFRGTSVRRKIITVDAGFVILDEVDEMVQKNIETLDKRLGASEYKFKMKLSTPTYTDYGIDHEYSKTDMREWNIQCDECHKWQVLDFFKNIYPEPTREFTKEPDCEPFFCCSHCGKPVDNCKDGQWVARYPDREKAGYALSKLFTNQMSAKEFWYTYRDSKNIQEFFNSDLGLPYDVDGGKLSDADIKACFDNYDDVLSCCYMGVDVGKLLHVVVSYKNGDYNQRLLVKTVKSFEELDTIMNHFDVSICVIDALPETRKAKEFAERFNGRVYLAFYNLNEKHEMAKFDQDKKVVRCHRTNVMELAANNIYIRKTRFRRDSEYIDGFMSQLKAPQKIEVLNEKTGNKEYRFLEGNNPDHYYHANVYCEVAMLNQSPSSYEPTEKEIQQDQQQFDEYFEDHDDDFSGGSF